MRFKITYYLDTNNVVIEDTFKPFRNVKVVKNNDPAINNAILEFYEEDYKDMKKVLGEEINEAEMMIYATKQIEKNIKSNFKVKVLTKLLK